MVYIISGPVNSGKTTGMISLYGKTGFGDGIVSVKKCNFHGVYGYDCTRLSTGETRPMARLKNLLPVNWDELYLFGPYSFSLAGFQFAKDSIEDILGKNQSPVFIDEAGPLELREMGHFNSIRKVLNSGLDLYLVVRSGLVDDVARFFGISDYRLLRENRLPGAERPGETKEGLKPAWNSAWQ